MNDERQLRVAKELAEAEVWDGRWEQKFIGWANDGGLDTLIRMAEANTEGRARKCLFCQTPIEEDQSGIWIAQDPSTGGDSGTPQSWFIFDSESCKNQWLENQR